jgi:uncharacterized protein YcfL
MNFKFLPIALVTIFLLVACGGNSEEDSTKEVKTEDIKTLVKDISSGSTDHQSASITSHQLTVTDSNNKEVVYDLSEEEFFVSIAPYINETHP